MLTCLRIRDLAIIDSLDVELGPGLNVVTGETGAGKSIMVDALELVLGGKGKPELVRTGAAQAEVEALFDIGQDAELRARLVELGVLGLDKGEGKGGLPGVIDDSDCEVVIRRVLFANGRTRAYVNGRMASAQQLAALVRGLADISSQHEHHTLSNPNTHLGYLDAFAGLTAQGEATRRSFAVVKAAHEALRAFETRLGDRAQREDLLRYQIKEIEDVSPHAGEELELSEQRDRLKHADKLMRLSGDAAEVLYERDGSVSEALSQVALHVLEAAQLDSSLIELASQLESARTQLEEAARELGRYTRSVHADPEALTGVEERLHALHKLKRKYGGTLEAVVEHLARSREELSALTDHEGTSEAMRAEYERALSAAAKCARALSADRKRAASKLAGAISKELASLGMGGARIEVDISPLEGRPGELEIDGARLSALGLDRAEFLIAPNKGEVARPLMRIASGGELSRAMLAIKRVLAGIGPAGMYVFDEVDSGVGGGIAEVIGRKIRDVAEHRQVLCITHLPQIAVFADHHYKVEKTIVGERTQSSVRQLSHREQQEEIARMLGGLRITAKTRAAAAEMLKDARASAA
jgi:DNA repair protein RecN (Recombination protein N)